MAEHDISLVTAKASNVVIENLKPSLATPSAAITPATVTAMVGMAQGGALQVAPAVTGAIASMKAKAASLISSAGIPELNTALGSGALSSSSITSAVAAIQGNANISAGIKASVSSLTASGGPVSEAITAAESLQALGAKMIPAGNPAAFGQLLMQAQSHIEDSIELTAATNFMANMKFSDYGTGIKDMTSLTTCGLSTVAGDLKAAAGAMAAAGPTADMSDIKNLGAPAGLISKLTSVKMGGSTGIDSALTKAGVDLTRLSDPVYGDTIKKVMGSIQDPKIISAVTGQLGISPGGSIGSLNDLTDLTKLAPKGSDILSGPKIPNLSGISASSITSISALAKIPTTIPSTGLTASLGDIGSKLGDLGAKFKSPADAAKLLSSIKVPNIPTLNAAVPSLSGLMSSAGPTLQGLTGTGSGALGMPSMTDFTQAVSGGPMISGLLAGGATPAAIANIKSMVASCTSLIQKAGVDLNTPPAASLGTIMTFGTSLHKMGADKSGSGIGDVLRSMATNDQYGEAIKASLDEGHNKAVMAEAGIVPPKHSPSPPPLPESIVNDNKRRELEAEYDNYTSLVYGNSVLTLKKHYAEKLVNEVIPAAISFYKAKPDMGTWLKMSEDRLGSWTNYISVVEQDIAAGA